MNLSKQSPTVGNLKRGVFHLVDHNANPIC